MEMSRMPPTGRASRRMRSRKGGDGMNSEEPELHVLDRQVCMRLIATRPFGRILYTAGALPAIQPVNYVLDEDHIVIRTDSLPKLAAAGRRQVVAFEIDDIDDDRGSGWSVVVTGHVREIVAEPDLTRARSLPIPEWILRGPDHRYIRIDCELVTGRSLTRPNGSASRRAGYHRRAHRPTMPRANGTTSPIYFLAALWRVCRIRASEPGKTRETCPSSDQRTT